MLRGDVQLLATADAVWAGSVAAGALALLDQLAPFSASSLAPDERMRMGDAECRLMAEAARTACFFLTRFAPLRRAVVFDTQEEGLCVAPLLRVFLGASNAKRSNSAASEALQQLAPVCAQALVLLSCGAEHWALLPSLPPSSSPLRVQYVPITGDSTPPQALCVPSFLTGAFLYPTSCLSTANEYSAGSVGANVTGHIHAPVCEVRVHCSAEEGEGEVETPSEVLGLLVSEARMPSEEKVHVATATRLFGLIVKARNHATLREALACTICVCLANPSLLSVFLTLRISLVTAVSNVLTTAPRTHRDHVTLHSVLDFVDEVFKALRIRGGGGGGGLSAEVAELFSETVGAVLPAMSRYFKEHFGRSNASVFPSSSAVASLALTPHRGEVEREYVAATSAVCSAFLSFLLTLTSYSTYSFYSTLAMPAYLTGLLHHIACSELHGAHLRVVAVGALENMVRWHGGWEALCCLEDQGGGSSGSRLSGFTPPVEFGPSLQCLGVGREGEAVCGSLARVVRLLRAPDSLVGSSSVVGCLRLLHLCLLQLVRGRAVVWSEAEAGRQWRWLTRLLYDRRTDVKLIAVQVLALLLKHTARPAGGSQTLAYDSLDSDAEEAEVEAKEEGGEPDQCFPPYELLGHLASDSTESVLLRAHCVGLLSQAFCDPLLRRTSKITPSLLVSAICDCVSLHDPFACAASMHSALQSLLRLLACRDVQAQQSVLEMLARVKAVPLVVELLSAQLEDTLSERAMGRVRVRRDDYVSSQEAHYDDAIARLQGGDEELEFCPGSAWASLLNTQRGRDRDALRGVTSSAAWFLFQLRAVESGLFDQCVRHSNLVFHLTTSFSQADPRLHSLPSRSFDLDCDCTHAQAELLSLLIGAEANKTHRALEGDKKTYMGEGEGPLAAFVRDNSLVPSNVLKKVVLVLRSLMERGFSSGGGGGSLRLQCASSCLRLLCAMMGEPHWCEGLGLGGAQEGVLSDSASYLFELLLAMREVLQKSPTMGTGAGGGAGAGAYTAGRLLSRLDFTLAMAMQHSFEARMLFVKHSVEAQMIIVAGETGGGGAGAGGGQSLFMQYVGTIASAVELLDAPTPAPAPTLARSVGSRASSRGASGGRRGGAGPVADAGAGGRPSVGQSMSSWATRSSQSSKWRDKTRGYAWNRDKEDKGVSAELPDALKLRLWTALTVLSKALPLCDSATDWAIELRMHHLLSRLLRFAAKHSLLVRPPGSGDGVGQWVPSNGMLAAAVCSLCCAFTYRHTHAKQCLASTGEAPAALLSGSASAGTTLHQLVTLGISRSVVPVVRWLCLGVAGSLLSGVGADKGGAGGGRMLGAPTAKSTLAQVVALCIQRSLHASHADPEAVVHLLNALACFLGAEEDLSLLTQLSAKEGTSLRAQSLSLVRDTGGEGGSADFKLISFPELVQWVMSAGERDDVRAAVSRLLGRVSAVDRSNKTVGNLLSEELLQVLCESYHAEGRASDLSALSLWSIVHGSEKAKCMVRDILRRMGGGGGGGAQCGGGRNKENMALEAVGAQLSNGEDPAARARHFVDALVVA
ncbi:hypothetical protein B484DRAFT_448568 [Ochromonadaceae sp. CCMP2298]|nr:hypothetical protein B484DRAFT_448568 [Ochromonadaceae sp. CCMP2298]